MSSFFELSDETKKNNEIMAIAEIKKLLMPHEGQLNIKDLPLSDSIPAADDLLIDSIGVGNNLQDIEPSVGDMIASAIINQLKRQKLFKYFLAFFSIPPKKEFYIRYLDIEEALNKLGVKNNNNFFAIFTGNFNKNELPLKVKCLYIPSLSKTMILICSKDDLPKITKNIPTNQLDGYKKIGDNLFFPFNQVEGKISLATYVGVEVKPSMQYILINVTMSNYTGNFDLNKIQNIYQLLG